MFVNASSVRPEQYYRLPDVEKRARHIVHYLKKHGRDQAMDIIHTFLTSEPMGPDYAKGLYNQLPLEVSEYYVPVPDHFLDIANGKRESLLSSEGNSMQKEADKLAEKETKLEQEEKKLNEREAELNKREAELNKREAELNEREVDLSWREPFDPSEHDQGTSGSRLWNSTWDNTAKMRGFAENDQGTSRSQLWKSSWKSISEAPSHDEDNYQLELCKQHARVEKMQDEGAEPYGYGQEDDRQLEICKELAFAQKMQDKDDRQLEWMYSDQRQFGCFRF